MPRQANMDSLPDPASLLVWAAKSGFDLMREPAVAVGLSGGPDSMALTWLLSQLYAAGQCPPIHALTVDHDLRPGSAEEAAYAAQAIAGWPGVNHNVLHRPAPDGGGRVMERARQDRYKLLGDFCAALSIRLLFIAHHEDDQAETVLFRLAKGSGLDGLAGMRNVTGLPSGVMLCRALLDYSKASLIALCHRQALVFTDDPSNENKAYARPRLRSAMAILGAEGLSPRRLAVTAARFQRAAEALETMAEKAGQETVIISETDRIVFRYSILKAWPAEIRFRVLRNACLALQQAQRKGYTGYGPRMQPLENLADAFFLSNPQCKATLGGCLFTLEAKNDMLEIVSEAASSQQ